MVTIDQLNTKYGIEDGNWSFSLFPGWLERKGIPNTRDLPIVAATLEQILIEFKPETLPEKHHDFDNFVLQRAIKNKEAVNKSMLALLNDSVQQSLKVYDAEWEKLSKWQKIKEVMKG